MQPSVVAPTLLIPWFLLLASCTSPPKPPTVDESQRRPANSALAVELQGCRSALQNTSLFARESAHLAKSTAAKLASVSKSGLSDGKVTGASASPANRLYAIRFDYGSTHVSLPADASGLLVEAARTSSLIVLRGRTDGTHDTPAEARIARERAARVRDFLVSLGADPSRIRATHQASGDHLAENTSTSGRAMNRRVEIEFYRMPPVALEATAVAQH